MLSEFNRIDDLYVFIGNLEGEDIYKLDVKKVINLIQKNYFVGNKLSSSTIELFSQFNPHYNSLCSLYRAVLFLTKSDILCEFNKDNNGKSNRKANPIYAQVLLNNIAQEISFPPLPYASTLDMIISDIYSDLSSNKEFAEMFYLKIRKQINSNLEPSYDINDNLENCSIIDSKTTSFDDFLNTYCNIKKSDNKYMSNGTNVSNKLINKFYYLYQFFSSSELTELIRDETFGQADSIALSMIPIESFLSKDNYIYTLGLAEYLTKCYSKNEILKIYKIEDHYTILAKLFLFSASYLKLYLGTKIKFRKCNICKHDYIINDNIGNNKDKCSCYICRNKYTDLISKYNKKYYNSIRPNYSKISFSNKTIQDNWSNINQKIEKCLYYEVKKSIKEQILNLDRHTFQNEIKTELEKFHMISEIILMKI